MTKTLYIPTSTLNYNNILSSESISPKSFYEKRGFGYKTWTSIPENNIDNAILLYDKPFSFSRPICDVEDHPMLIEIITDKEFPSIDEKEGIYYSDHTIYLSPWRTRFIFFSEQHKKIATSRSEYSAETKMTRLYKKLDVEDTYTHRNSVCHNSIINLNKDAIEQDHRLNKMKGLLYGYYIGASLSTSSQTTQQYNNLQELEEILYTILSSPKHVPNINQQEKIKEQLRALQENHPGVLKLKEKFSDPNDVFDTIDECQMSLPDFINYHDFNNLILNNQAGLWIERKQKKLEEQTKQEQKLLPPSKEEIIVTECQLSKILNDNISTELDKILLNSWINDILSSEKYNKHISTFKNELADELTDQAKNIYQDLWEKSETRIQLNEMRRYIRGLESSFQWNNILISSIAAVLYRGDDWEKLLKFMKRKSISDYRLAFAFYGTLNGFANLTRDFTDCLFNLQDKNYIAEVYKEVYGQLLGEDAGNITIRESTEKSFIEKKKENIRKYIKNIRRANPQSIEEVFQKLGDSFTEVRFLEELSLTSGWKSKNLCYKKLEQYLQTDEYKKLTSNFSISKPNKEKEIEKQVKFHFQNIENIITEIRHFMPHLNEKTLKYLKKDIEWVLNPKYSKSLQKQELLKELQQTLYQSKDSSEKNLLWKKEVYKELDIDKIIDFLNKAFN